MKLSIITINYNNLEGLRRTYESVVCQTFQDFEWIIIDGGSNDGSREFIEQHQEKFVYWCSEPDGGIYNALNKGIAHANGEYVSCMNSGDAYHSSDTLISVFSRNHYAGIIYGDALWSSRADGCPSHFRNPVDIYELYYASPCHQTMFVRADLLVEKGFDESYRITADYARWVELALHGCEFEYVPLVICDYDTNGISATNVACANEERQRVRREVYPSAVREAIKRHDYYRHTYEFVRVKDIVDNGGITLKALRLFITVVDTINDIKKMCMSRR